MSVPSNHTLSVTFLVMACVALLLALETGYGVIESTICILLASQLYAVEHLAGADA